MNSSPQSSRRSDHRLRQALRPAGPPYLDFSAQRTRHEVLVTIEGELDILTAPRLASQLNTLILTAPTDMVLDLRRVEFIDSSGLQILMNARRRLDRRSRKLTVICDEGPVRRVIELARLVGTLGVVPGADAKRQSGAA